MGASPQTLILPSKSLIPSESSQLTSPTSCQRSCEESFPQIRQNTASRECNLTLALTPSRAPSTTCPSPQHSTESQTCRSFYTSLSLVPPDPRLHVLLHSALRRVRLVGPSTPV